jgi:hypothetical protein
MRLDINSAIQFILALPAHRSNNAGHQQLGIRTLDYLFEFKADEDGIDCDFNKEIIISILSAVRAFSVERDALASRWDSQKEIKEKREILISSFKKFLPLEEDNHWAKIISFAPFLATYVFLFINNLSLTWYQNILLISLPFIFLQLIGTLSIHIIHTKYLKRADKDKADEWQNSSMQKYQHIVSCFIDEYVSIFQKYYPDVKKLYGFDMNDPKEIEAMKVQIIKKQFYLA